jgi:hypothetical protein
MRSVVEHLMRVNFILFVRGTPRIEYISVNYGCIKLPDKEFVIKI